MQLSVGMVAFFYLINYPKFGKHLYSCQCPTENLTTNKSTLFQLITGTSSTTGEAVIKSQSIFKHRRVETVDPQSCEKVPH